MLREATPDYAYGLRLNHRERTPPFTPPFRSEEYERIGAASEAKKPCILIIEDNVGDVFVVEEALREHQVNCDLTVIADGEAAIRHFDRIDGDPAVSCPHLVLLDLNLPKLSGHTVLDRIRRGARCPTVPVVIVTSSESEADLALNRRLGATAYFKKPSSLEGFMELGGVVKTLLTRQ